MADMMAEESVQDSAGSWEHSHSDSRENSMNNEQWQTEEQNKENTQTNTLSRQDSASSDGSGSGQLILHDGGKLVEESRTDMAGFTNPAFKSSTNGDGISTHTPEVPPRQSLVSGGGGGGGGGGIGTARYRALKSGNIVTSIPEEEITIPNDGNLASFSADAMATFLRYLRLDDRLVNHMHRNGLDGRRFGRLKDSDLNNLKLSNPVLVYFRDRTAPAVTKKSKPRLPFIL